ncbi:hypothetical protein PSAB6_410099 [Paraburkholderia sabiae]|nr:hypothetical protein PSAB6_410099 [Paraburkholderia sabiae]
MWGINGLWRDFLNSGAANRMWLGMWLARDGSLQAGGKPVALRHAACCLQKPLWNHSA